MDAIASPPSGVATAVAVNVPGECDSTCASAVTWPSCFYTSASSSEWSGVS